MKQQSPTAARALNPELDHGVELKASDNPLIASDTDENAAPKKDESFKNKRNQKALRKQRLQAEDKQAQSPEVTERLKSPVVIKGSAAIASGAGLELSDSKMNLAKLNSNLTNQNETRRTQAQAAAASAKSGKQEAEAGSGGKKPAKKVVLKKSNIMEHLDKVDGACEYFNIINKENEEMQSQIQAKILKGEEGF